MPALRLLCALALAIAGLGIAGSASAQDIVTADPMTVASVVREQGFDAEISKDKDGDPMIRVEARGYRYVILFYGCTNGKDCTSLGLYSFVSGEGVDIDKVNKWNHDNRFGRAYIDDDKDGVVEMDINLEQGGMSQALFADHIDKWMYVLAQFNKAMVD